ncbi:hypothetical protein PYK79_45075 [Streptomyces sp. ID05-04B]|uniref:hypothetical protein n=1 Tax=unclassified Streptomyces TaxID=2593676 RepID=UPI000D19A8CA|nr:MULTISPECIES: hypothetical protein [unclassified Streptomyces]AVV46435.1 hypothetical protein C6376_38860 [Streptomyces sp. P3]AVV46494.1 hypothetical protein C6376_39160 [Streptomyces sp. P3]MDX5569021.1 hypothetical protein [Streptomyces sp. ID05-04B]
MTTRDTTPTPSAPRCGTPVPGGRCTAPADGPAAAAAVPTREPFDRHQWERAVITSSLHHNPRHVALLLAHFADDAGYLPPGGPQHVDSLTASTGLTSRLVRQSLTHLEAYGFVSRPPIHGWDPRKGVRPLTLTTPPARVALSTPPARVALSMPPARPGSAAAEGAARTEPAHPGETR